MLAQIQTREAGDEAAAAQEQLCAHRTVTKAHPKGTFPCPVPCAGTQGTGPAGEALCSVCCAQGGNVTAAGKGLQDPFPSFTGAFSSCCAQFQVVVQPDLGDCVWGIISDGEGVDGWSV